MTVERMNIEDTAETMNMSSDIPYEIYERKRLDTNDGI
jgi:hypothetical protein